MIHQQIIHCEETQRTASTLAPVSQQAHTKTVEDILNKLICSETLDSLVHREEHNIPSLFRSAVGNFQPHNQPKQFNEERRSYISIKRKLTCDSHPARAPKIKRFSGGKVGNILPQISDIASQNVSKNLTNKVIPSYFSANINENNDNYPISTKFNGEVRLEEEFPVTHCVSRFLVDQIESTSSVCKRATARRRSYNTNPLSCFHENPQIINQEIIRGFPELTDLQFEELKTSPKTSIISTHIDLYASGEKVPEKQQFSCITKFSQIPPCFYGKKVPLKHSKSDPGIAGAQTNFSEFLDKTNLKGETCTRSESFYNFKLRFPNIQARKLRGLNENTNATANLQQFCDHQGINKLPITPVTDTRDLTVLPNLRSNLADQKIKNDAGSLKRYPERITTSIDKLRTSFIRKQNHHNCACLPQTVRQTQSGDPNNLSQSRRTKCSSYVKKTYCTRQKRFLDKGQQTVLSTGQRDQQQRESKIDQDIAASVRCLCKITSVAENCSVCTAQINPNCDSERSPTSKKESLFFAETKRCCNCERKRINIFKRSQQREDEIKPKELHFSNRRLSKRSFSNNHKSLEDQLPGHQNVQKKSNHCCDAFCLFFGGTSQQSSLVFNKLLYAAQAASPKHRNLGIITSDQADMGCFHSVSNKSKVGPCRTNIHSDVQATIDQSPTVIEEYSPIVLRYRTPYFRANAQVIMPPIRRKETWTVGWIQACDYMKFINQYGNLGCSSWEIPALKSGLIPAVSDSDGVSYPWYGNTTEIATIVGPTDTYKSMNLTMNDNFYPSVTWDIPVSEGTNAHLTRIIRDQSFVTWLAAINETTKEIIVLKTVRWKFYLEIDIDPTRELGNRARIVAPRIQKQPMVTSGPCEKSFFNSPVKNRRRGIDNNSNSNYVGQIPISALVRPSANNAQTLIWRPSETNPIIVVPAKEEHKETNELILFNGCSAMLGKESIVKEISKQEMLQFQQMTR